MPRRARPAGTTVDPRNGAFPELDEVDEVEVPTTPAKLSPWAQERWDGYWAGDAARVVVRADWSVAERWITCLDRWFQVSEEAAASPLTEGSTGQLVANPLWKVAETLILQVERAEKILGIGPAHRAALGIRSGSSSKTGAADQGQSYRDAAAAWQDPRQ